MVTFVNNLSASYFVGSETLRIHHEDQQIFTQCIENHEDMDYWNTLYFGDDVYDINLHRYDGNLSLQMYPVINNEVNGSIWQDIRLKVYDI